MEGRILTVNTGSTSTKIGFFDAGELVFEQKVFLSAETLAKYGSVMDLETEMKDAITEFLLSKGVELETIDVVMARGGLITPVVTGVYRVNKAMRDALYEGKEGVHACNLSAIIADDIAVHIDALRKARGLPPCRGAFIADPPMADEMLPELKFGGRPEFPRRTLFHALNSRAMVRRYARSMGKTVKDVTAIVAHLGGGVSVSLHRGGRVIDTNDALGGDGPVATERAGTVPAFPLVEMCFSGRYTKEEVKKLIVGRGGVMSYFGTNDFREVVRLAREGNADADLFITGYCAGISKYIGYFAPVVCGKVDVIILTGGIAHEKGVTDAIARRVGFIAPVVVYPGENELTSLAENGYGILSGEFEVRTYDPNRL